MQSTPSHAQRARLALILPIFGLATLGSSGCSTSETGTTPTTEWAVAIRSETTELAKKLAGGSIAEDPVVEDSGIEESEMEDSAFEAPRTGGEVVERLSGGTVPPPPSAGPTTPGPGAPPREAADFESRGGIAGDGAPSPSPALQAQLPKVEVDVVSSRAWKRRARRFARVEVGRDETGVKTLNLRKLRVQVRIDGHRARTVVDHVYENPFDKQLEGRFTYPLPTGASACYYGMFLSADVRDAPPLFPAADTTFAAEQMPDGRLAMLAPEDLFRRADDRWGELREARVVAREQGRKVFEEIVRKKIDPALLEQDAGNRFVGRVFPIPARGFNRVVLAWEETLVEGSDGALVYRFPLPAEELDWFHFEATTDPDAWNSQSFDGPGQPVRVLLENEQVLHRIAAEGESVRGDVTWRLVPKNPNLQMLSGIDTASSSQAFAARLRPDFAVEEAADPSTHGVFVLDTSLSEDPERFAVHIRLLRQILERDSALERFQVLCFDVGVWRVGGESWLSNDAPTRTRVFDALDAVLLEGATDLSAAVEILAGLGPDSDGGSPEHGAKRPLTVFFLSNGEVTWGDGDASRLTARAASGAHWDPTWYCYRSGVGAENVELFDALTRRGGATLQVPDEAAAPHVALAHRRKNFVIDSIRVTSDAGVARDLVVRGRQVAVPSGGDLVIAGRCPKAATRGEILVEGRIGSKKHYIHEALSLGGTSQLAARAWADIAVEQMLALRDPRVDRLATAYAQRHRIGSRVTSFLVLETDAEYEQYDITAASSDLKIDDMERFFDEAYRSDTPITRRVAFGRFLKDASERTGLLKQGKEAHVRDLFARMRESDFEMPRIANYGELPVRTMVSREYLQARAKDRRDFGLYTQAAQRRLGDGRDFLGLRALSSIVELEPGRSGALRLVGYRLLGLERPDFATVLFEKIRDSRPFEPHGYRDLARTFERLDRPALAAIHYELVLAGEWGDRFGESIKVVARDEYRRLLRTSLRNSRLDERIAESFESRLASLGGEGSTPRLRVTISWNTDNTDIDLWVVEPSGEACGYNHQETRTGGRLLEDLTGGYGPERYENADAPGGEYVVLVKYYSDNPNLIGNETAVEVVVTRDVGSEREAVVRYDVVLTKDGQSIEVCRLRL